jgi:hypothetical protein
MFSDEKIFTQNGGLNKQNNRVFALSRKEANERGGTIHYFGSFLLFLYSLFKFLP